MAYFSLSLAITLAILYTAGCSPATTTTGGSFTVDLIHRDSIKSPFYDGSLTFSQRLGLALKRSFMSAKRFKSNSNLNASTYQTEIIPDHGEFLLNISFGNPSHKILAIADTGSDLSWIQCKPCIQCYKHKGSLYNPKKSSTYKTVDCNSETCKSIMTVETNCSLSKICQFYESYADGSFSNGNVSTETLQLGNRVLPNIIFGCAFSNAGIFRRTWGGILGLGGGNLSLVSQIRKFVSAKFSYCLIPYPMTNDISSESSKMIFGDIDLGPNSVSTPLIQTDSKTFYYVTFEGISVENKRLGLSDGSNSSKASDEGNMIVDSGTTLTMLPSKLYKQVETSIKDVMKLETVEDPQGALSLCYLRKRMRDVPKLTVHFKGADIELTKENTFVTVSKHIMCFAMGETSDIPILGNLAQMNYMVGFDLENKMLSFKRTDCTKL